MRRTLLVCCVAMLACSEPTGLESTRELAVIVNDLYDPAWPRDAITIDSVMTVSTGHLRAP